jgi:hypothetical protein
MQNAQPYILDSLLLIVVCLLLFVLYRARRKNVVADLPSNNKSDDVSVRSELARNVMIFAVTGVILLSVVVLCVPDTKLPTAQLVFGAILPLLGTWIGTIMAYYFSRDNLDAATKSVSTMANLSIAERLRVISVQAKMIAFTDIKSRTIIAPADESTTLLNALNPDNVQRIIILNTDKSVRYLIYKDTINEYLASFSAPAPTFPPGKTSVTMLTLSDLLSDSGRKSMFKELWGVVAPNATLADAKAAMDSLGKKCNDVFVTKDGDRQSELAGWITDDIIAMNSKV